VQFVGRYLRGVVLDVQRDELRAAEWLLNRVDERDQLRRCQQPVPSLDRALENMCDPVDVGARPEMLLCRGLFDAMVDELAQPPPLSHQIQRVFVEIAAERDGCHRPLREAHAQQLRGRVPGWRDVVAGRLYQN